MRDSDLIVLSCIAVGVAGALGIDTIGYGHGMRVLGFPAFIGLAIVLLCGLQAWYGRRESGRSVGQAPASAGLRQTIRAGLAFLVVLPVVAVFGLVLGLPAFVAAYLKLRGEGWRVTAGAATIALAGAPLFAFVFGVPQPKGLLAWP
jgi:hypothetical protein